MKKILFFILIPSLSFCQDVVSDTVYLQKQGLNYFIISQIIYSDSTVNIDKKFIGDSLKAISYTVDGAERISGKMSEFAYPFIFNNKSQKQIKYFNDLHLQINKLSIYNSTAQRDTAKFIGDWKLNFNGEIIDGKIELNNNKRLIFNPDNGKVYTISTNLLLSTFTNQVSFAFNGIKYDLYKYADGKFATVDGDIRLIKLE